MPPLNEKNELDANQRKESEMSKRKVKIINENLAIVKAPYDRAGLMYHETVHIKTAGRFMMDFIGRWGMVAAVPDGEDQAGRQKLRLATESELVARAVNVTRLALTTMKAEGWAVDVPSLKELVDFETEEKDA